jgi:Mg2+/Co2+ transporter CorB
VHYIPVNAGLQDVLTASLMTGRQLFIAVDEHGTTKGLITLADTLAHLNGEPLPKEATVTTKPPSK